MSLCAAYEKFDVSAVGMVIFYRRLHRMASAAKTVFGLRRCDGFFPVYRSNLRRFRGPHFPDYRGFFRRFVALRLHHQARIERHGLVPVYGAYRHYFGVYRQFFHAKPGHSPFR